MATLRCASGSSQERVEQERGIFRRWPLVGAAAAAVASFARSVWADSPSRAKPARFLKDVVVPLIWRQGGFSLRYRLLTPEDVANGGGSAETGQIFSGVVDTGSPFLLVGSCLRDDCAKYCARWGCYAGEGSPSGFSATYEAYVAGVTWVQWRRGVALLFLPRPGEPESAPVLGSPDLVFGVKAKSLDMGGMGAGVFFGLVRETRPGVRPSFLSQTPFKNFGIDLRQPGREALMLMRQPSKGTGAGDWLPLVNPMQWGGLIGQYASVASCVRVGQIDLTMPQRENSEDPPRQRRVLCIFDTGTTGVSMTPGLYQVFWNTARRAVWNNAREGQKTSFSEARRLEFVFTLSGGKEIALCMQQGKHPTYGIGLDVVTPVRELGWAGIGDDYVPTGECVPVQWQSASAWGSPCARPDLPFDDVAYLGLGFLVGRELRFDLESSRIWISRPVTPV